MNETTFKRLILGLILGFAAIVLYVRNKPAGPCGRPIGWAIGSLDRRFNLSSEAAKDAAIAAMGLWNRAAGRPVFAVQQGAPLKINFVYDERQANLARRGALTSARASLDTTANSLESQLAWVRGRQASYNQEVAAINARGGATPAESQSLAAERREIQALADSLHQAASSYRARGDAVRSDIHQYNEHVGRAFDAGHYVREQTRERIDIFAFDDDVDLTRTLAHEFGHALGLDHNDDATSIMYARNEGQELTPSAADLAALRQRCKR